MRIYIATKFENHPRAQEIAKQLQDYGHKITYKWWEAGVADAEQAYRDFMGVMNADALVLIVEKDFRYSGALTEFGIALGAGIPVYIMGNQLDIEPAGATPNIFTLLPDMLVHRGIGNLLQ